MIMNYDNKSKIVLFAAIAVISFMIVFLVTIGIKNMNATEIRGYSSAPGKKYSYKEDVEEPTIKKLTSTIEDSSCSGTMIWKIDKDKIVEIKDVDVKNLFGMTFRSIENDGKLSKKISGKLFTTTYKTLFNSKPKLEMINNYNYNGKVYTYKKGNIVQVKKEACKGVTYDTLLTSYTYGDESLSLTMNVAYVKNDKVYDAYNKLLGKYEIGTYAELLRTGTKYTYRYKLISGNYVLNSISAQ